MNTPEGKAWRTLAGIKGVGPKALWLIAGYLAQRQKTASWLLQNSGEIEVALRMSKAGIMLSDFKEKEYEEVEKFAGRELSVLHPLHPDFPPQIKNLKDAISLPAILYVRGNSAILNRPSVAIVGKRDAGKTAIAVADSLARELAGKGINIISGYAAGIDSAAHLAALHAGGTTGIVLAEGIARFRIKPELKDLLTKNNSILISQFEPAAKWAAYMAMTRNKLICALSGAVVVVVSGPERNASGRNSGTFNTGMAALKMGIPIFVVTPSFFADNPEGNRQLIARGCRAWEPAAGIAPIIAALKSAADHKPPPEQLNLFEQTTGDE